MGLIDTNLGKPDHWKRTLLIFVSGFLFFEMLTGLGIYFMPFSLTTQTMVLIHTVVGLIFIIPYGYYQLQHWLYYRRRQMTHHKLTGYVSMFSTTAAIISGLVLSYQAAFMTQISYFWDTFHVFSTFALLISLLPHIIIIVLRDLGARYNLSIKSVLKAEKYYSLHTAYLIVLQFALVALLLYAYEPVKLNNSLPDDYHFTFGKDRPFAPSQAKTATGHAIDARLLGGSESCGSSGCHDQIKKEWEASAHRYSAQDPAFRAIQNIMGQQNGPESTRYCGGCHDPISLFSGTKNLFKKELTNKTGLDEGISCLSCHAIKQADVKGNAEYVIEQPQRYMFEMKNGKTAKMVSDFLIRAYPEEHKKSYERPLFKTPEFCGSCHKQFIDKEINDVGWVQLQNQYDNWRKSRWNHPKQADKTIECRECHMPLVDSFDPASGDAMDYNRTPNDGMHRSHRFLGANNFVPKLLKLPGGEKQAELVTKWLQGKIDIPEIADKWRTGPAIPIELMTPDSVRAGSPFNIDVMITNNKAGHNFPTGPLDIIQAWVELTVKDEKGNEIFTSGSMDNKHFIQQGSFVFKAEPVDQYNNIIDRHNLWEMVGVRYTRALFPGYSDNARYSITVPDSIYYSRKLTGNQKFSIKVPKGASKKLEVSARLRYRKINQYLMNQLFGEKMDDPTAPVTTLSETHKTLIVQADQSDLTR